MAALARHHGMPPAAEQGLNELLRALAAEPNPPTTVAEPARAVDLHLADSLSGLEVEALRSARTIADVGSGAGFPGLPLAIALASSEVDLLESSARKAEVIDRLRAAAAAGNARAIAARAEDWAREQARPAYDAVTARAVAPLAVLCEYAAPLLGPTGLLVAWKGSRRREEEGAAARAAAELGLEAVEVRHVQPFPGARDRHLHVFIKTGTTPQRFPRRAGMAVKRPLGS